MPVKTRIQHYMWKREIRKAFRRLNKMLAEIHRSTQR